MPDAMDADPLARHSLTAVELKQVLEAARVGAPLLAYRDGDRALCLFTLAAADARYTLGRSTDTDLPITWDDQVSGLHAQVEGLGGEWTVADDGLSRNGTHVNGQRVTGRQRLRDGDRIRVGNTVLAYKAANAAPVPETVVAGTSVPEAQSITDTQRRVLVALCRPYRDGDTYATPATNQEIAAEVFLSVDAVKMHLRTLYGKFGLGDLAQNEKRARLAASVLQLGIVTQRDLG